MADDADFRPGDTIPAGAITEPAPLCCVQCRYDLRGLPADGRCPECGLPVRNSGAAPDELHLAPRGWLGSVARGAALLLSGQVLLASPLLVSPLLGARRDTLWWIYTGVAVQTIAAVVIGAGAWLVTRRQTRFGPSGFARRWLVRLFAGCWVVSFLFGVAIYFTGNMDFVAASPHTGRAAAILLPFALFGHLRRLALCARNGPLAEHCRMVGAGLTGSVLLSAAIDLAAEHQWFRGGSPTDAFLVTLALGFVFYAWATITLLRVTLVFGTLRRDSAN
jgi:hypothetical protein